MYAASAFRTMPTPTISIASTPNPAAFQPAAFHNVILYLFASPAGRRCKTSRAALFACRRCGPRHRSGPVVGISAVIVSLRGDTSHRRVPTETAPDAFGNVIACYAIHSATSAPAVRPGDGSLSAGGQRPRLGLLTGRSDRRQYRRRSESHDQTESYLRDGCVYPRSCRTSNIAPWFRSIVHAPIAAGEAVIARSIGPVMDLWRGTARKKESTADEGGGCTRIHADGSVRFTGRAPRA